MLIALLLALQGAVTSPSRVPALCEPVALERQIHWQRSLEDGLALAQAEKRPILVALNMDGESASERIVRERYRDPRFVALTRRFVCLPGSLFRHAPRDHTFEGQRIASPRLGEITSGEAILLEPILFDRFLGEERVAPRHALILPDGTKHFDLYRLFDLGELDRALESAQELAPPQLPRESAPLDPATLGHAQWLELAGARDHRERLRFESLLLPPTPIEALERALRALLERGNAGSLEALRIAYARCGEAPGRLAPLATLVARARGLREPAAALVRELLTDVPASLVQVELGARAELLEALAELGGDLPYQRSLLLSYAAAGDPLQERPRVLRWLANSAGLDLARRVEAQLPNVATGRVLASAQAIPREAPWRAPDDLPPAEEIEAELLVADEQLAGAAGELAVQARFARAALAAARSRIASGGSSIELLLGDASAALVQVTRATPGDVEAWLLLARASYLLSDFAAQEQAALGALAALPALDPQALERLLGIVAADSRQLALDAQALVQPRERQEAQRWLADACARLVESRSGGDPAVELEGLSRGLNAAALAALAPISTPTDWLTYSAFHAALGRRGEEIAIARQGLAFFPESQELRTAFYLAVWDRGWAREARLESEALAERFPDSGASRWYVGYAGMQEGNALRRAEDPRAAIAAYRGADQAFAASIQLAPEFKDSADYYRALAALGRGFAQLLIDERAEAARALVEGIAIRPAIAEVRDPLDREAVDLLDGALEWRESGPSPVEPLALLAELERADPGNPAWARRVSDSELREGLRADGRGEPEIGDRYLEQAIAAARRAVERSTEDADRRALAQALSVHAERRMARAEFEAARPLLVEVAGLLGEAAPAGTVSDGEQSELAARLRARLGEARPLIRPGR